MGTRILVIDDDEKLRITLKRMLTEFGFEVSLARNGEEGELLLGDGRFDVVISDIIMPDQDGIETVARLRQKFPEVKIIAISGGGRLGHTDVLRVAAKVGADTVVAKPFRINQIVEAVEGVIAGNHEGND